MDLSKLKTARPLAQLKQGRGDWYRITNQGETAEVMIYDEIGYWGVSADQFVREIQNVTAKSLTVRLNSPGGEVFDGIAIYNSLKSHPATVNVKVEGLAASAASFIAMAGDTVEIARNAMMMVHDAHGLAIGNAGDMRQMADLLDQTSANIADMYAQRSGKTVDHWRTVMKAETWYTGQQAVDAGLADQVYDDAPVENSFDLSIFANMPKPGSHEPEEVSWDDIDIDPESIRLALKGA
jgi:ATP-dependent protease ClpP protease subunit